LRRLTSALPRRNVLSFIVFAAVAGVNRAALAADDGPSDVVAAIYKAAAGPGGKYDDGTSVFFDPAARKTLPVEESPGRVEGHGKAHA
jgi:hypothetical protein